MGDRRSFIINEIVKYSHKLEEKGFGANHDGNISAKFANELLATPTAVSKGNITAEMIITLDSNGTKISGVGNPFSEIKLHLAAYRARPEIKAVLHAHPPFATARGVAQLPLEPKLPEAIISLGKHIPVTAFTMPGAEESAAIIAQALTQADVFLMPGNGVLAVGNCVEQAYLRLELTEHLAKIAYYTPNSATPLVLSAAELEMLSKKHVALGSTPTATATIPQTTSPNNTSAATIRQIVVAEVKKALTTLEQ